MMTAIKGIFDDERSAVSARHAAIASIVAVVGVATGIFLIFAGNEIYERSTRRVLWALIEDAGVLDV